MGKINGLNYDAVLSSEDYKSYRQAIESEIITRFKMGSGFPYQNPQFGILDVENPSNATSTETNRPLLVAVASNLLEVKVFPGYAIAPDGTILHIPTLQQSVKLADVLQSGKIYAIVVESYVNTTAGTTQLNDYGISQSSQEVVETVVTSYEYSNSWAVLENQVVVAVVKVVDKTGGGQELQIDLSQNTYAFNRPWFSLLDTQHRALVGSGEVTPTNPHGTSINDLTLPGTVGLFQGLTGQGSLVSRDVVVNKMLGAKMCVDDIQFTSILTDSTGTVTAGSIYNKVGAKYAYLNNFPIRLGSIWGSDTRANAISGEVIMGTNMIVFGPDESFFAGQTIKVQYTSCLLLQPPTTITSNLLEFENTSVEGEAVTAGGYIYPTIPDSFISFEGLGPFARRYKTYLMDDAVLRYYPQILVPPQSAFLPVESITPQFPSRISVGLTNTTGASTLEVIVTVVGDSAIKNTEDNIEIGQEVTETLVFTPATGYVDQVIPSSQYDLGGQILTTSNVFSGPVNITIQSVTDAGPYPLLQLWAEVEPATSVGFEDNAPIAEIFWNGSAVTKAQDIRRVSKNWYAVHTTMQAAAEVELDSLRLLNFLQSNSLLAQSSVLLFAEDFEDLKHFDSAKGFQSPTKAVGTLGLNSSITLLAGDTIVVNTSPLRILTAITGTPSSPGEFDVGSLLSPIPLSEIRTNIITAINDTLFDAQVVASEATSPLNINLELQSLSGVAANSIVLSATTANVGALAIAGYNFAQDGYGECYLDREQVGLKSTYIPDNSNLNPYTYQYRRRYRSRAAAIPATLGPQSVFAIQILGEDKGAASSIRIRGSRYTNPKVWEGWELPTVAAAGAKGLYLMEFAEDMHKVQVEFYGKARGIAVYMVRS